MIRNPNDSFLQKQIDELRGLLRANPLRSMSVEQGRTRFYNNSQLLIEDSNLDVTGTATIIGHLRVVGRVLIEGLGILTVNGLIELLGRMRVSGGGGITVEGGGDIEVDGGKITVGNVVLEDGKITAGNVTVEPDKITVGGGSSPATLQDGALGFGTGGKVEADPTNGGVRMTVGANRVYVGTGAVALQVGSRTVTVTSSGVTFGGLPTVPKSNTPDSNPIGSMFVDSSGQAYRVVDG